MLLLRGFILQPIDRAYVLLRNSNRDFQNSPPPEVLAYFYTAITGNLNVFNTLTLKQIFWKTKTFFKNLEYRILAQITKIESAILPYKTALWEANIMTKRSTKRTYNNKWSFARNYFILLKFCFSLRNSHKELIWWTTTNQISIFILFRSSGVSFEDSFPLWVSLKWKILKHFAIPKQRAALRKLPYKSFLLLSSKTFLTEIYRNILTFAFQLLRECSSWTSRNGAVKMVFLQQPEMCL